MFGDPEWGVEAQAWFRRRVRRYLEDVRDCGENRPWFCYLLVNEKALEWIVEEYCARPAQFVQWEDGWLFDPQGNNFDPDRGTHGRWVFQKEAVSSVAYQTGRHYQEVISFESLEDWLEGEANGETLWCGPKEPHARDIGGRPNIDTEAYLRREQWPKACRDCRESFVPDRSGVVRCPDCRAAKRKARA